MAIVSHRHVEFRDTDAAGIVHFSVFYVWMEQAEHAALRSAGLSVHTKSEEGTISWPRISASCEFRSPLRFEDTVQIEVRISDLGTKSIRFEFEFTCEDRDVARGSITTVCCQLTDDGGWKSIPIPDEIRTRLETLT